jgi:hypothetical protein
MRAGIPRRRSPPQNFPSGALVAQVGASTETILVGRELALLAPESGELFLSMNDRFRDFSDNTGRLVVRIEVPVGAMGPRPPRPADFVGRWQPAGARRKARGEGPEMFRTLRSDGTLTTGLVSGTWVARSGKEAVLRLATGAVERIVITAPGVRATLQGEEGRTFFLVREEAR